MAASGSAAVGDAEEPAAAVEQVTIAEVAAGTARGSLLRLVAWARPG